MKVQVTANTLLEIHYHIIMLNNIYYFVVCSPLFYIKRAIKWMDKIGLQVSLDLHTGPGSQNGYDNSGRRYVLN